MRGNREIEGIANFFLLDGGNGRWRAGGFLGGVEMGEGSMTTVLGWGGRGWKGEGGVRWERKMWIYENEESVLVEKGEV